MVSNQGLYRVSVDTDKGNAHFPGDMYHRRDCNARFACYIRSVPAYLRSFAGVSLRRRP